MKDLARAALDTAIARKASYVDVRVMDIRQRYISTKNGQPSQVRDSRSFGLGIRVIAAGAWGFAATDELSRPAIDATAAQAVDIARATRPKEPDAPKFVPELLAWGAGPRASQYLILGGKARAILHGRLHVTTEDIREVAHPVLRHRLVTTFNADADGVTTDMVVTRLLQTIPLPQKEAAARARRA